MLFGIDILDNLKLDLNNMADFRRIFPRDANSEEVEQMNYDTAFSISYDEYYQQ
jgi:hypothetical protein